jgi:hypothetical protein
VNPNPIADLTAQVAASTDAGADGYSVLVVTPDESIARLVAPTLASRLCPDRIFAGILHTEWLGMGWEVVVRDLGAAR